MDERDFFNTIGEDRFPNEEASEFFINMRKEAGTAKEILDKGVEFASKNKVKLIGSAIGATAASVLQYMANKPGKDGVSPQRALAEKHLAGSEAEQKKMQADGKSPGMLQSLNHSRARATADISKVMEKHPKSGALIAAPAGAAIGAGLATLGTRILR